ncbi:hypothetical protein KXD93_16615 [Mucilaginibacter sp. BJC16-A38]|uniref:SDH family Clp fold serine proteinase n=1 Tax=Mucilaginibacter phenanthrenivorans TaxID=1234842 RepID=UPI002157A03D|nr:hypothetical protein [Mucilaginibacter phenanthrenivorans]MCR8559282.1 hypothetical protein [Mucilaginibacter phenanthrenivorans]
MSSQPATPARAKLKTALDWSNFISSGPKTGADLYTVRQQCYLDIEKYRKRPLIVYASNFTTSLAQFVGNGNSILLDDVDGFTDVLMNIDSSVREIDIIIHSPGGSPDATERIVSVLRNKFDKVHFLIPHSAYSAATMLALSGDSITLHPSATLGPIDPQLNGIPARSIIRGFENVKEAIKREGPEALPAYIPLIEKYTLAQLEQCNDAAALSKELVRTWLNEYMFNGTGEPSTIEHAVEYFSNYDEHKIHSRPLLFEKISGFGLAISQSDSELSDLLWESNITINGSLSMMPFSKLYENTHGISFGRQFNIPQQQGSATTPTTPQAEI